MTANPSSSLFVRSDLLLTDVRPSSIQHRLRSEQWTAPRRGIYIDANLTGDLKHRALTEAHLHRAGSDAALSHHSAAALHGFDSTYKRTDDIWITGPPHRRMVSQSGVTLVRSRFMASDQFMKIDGLPVTSRSRTVLDLASVLHGAELERVIESSLRGADHKRPDKWRVGVLDELVAFASGDRRRPGASALAKVLAMRGTSVRPTGSIAETAVIQGLRQVAIDDVIRQPTLRIVAADGTRTEIFPDILIPRRRLIVEIDGGDHLEPARFRADLARQNKLLVGFNLCRYTGADALFDVNRVVEEVKSYPVIEADVASFRWNVAGRVVEGASASWSLTHHR